ncbi:MAG: serine hydrolase domain-containing protein [Ilumatobacteraceae bacterium]
MEMPISTPSAQGVDPAGVAAFVDALDADPRLEPHGLIVQRHGHRIVEGWWAPHRAGTARLVYSLSKTFTGSALGVLWGDGRIGLDDLVSDHLPELFDDPAIDARTRRLTVRHVASMASGHDREMLPEAIAADPDDPVRGFLRIAPDAEPGTLFMYNQPPVLLLATILQRIAGERLVDLLARRVLGPIGVDGLRWAQLRPGIDLGYSGVYTDLDTIARLGQLYLDDGVWQGRQVLPSGWVAEASRVQTPNPERPEPDWQQGYGLRLALRHGYRGDGAYGQYMVVLPEHDAVVSLFSCVEDMQIVLDLMWQHLVPAMSSGTTTTTTTGSAGDRALAARLASLSMPTARTSRWCAGRTSLAGATAPIECAPAPARRPHAPHHHRRRGRPRAPDCTRTTGRSACPSPTVVAERRDGVGETAALDDGRLVDLVMVHTRTG